MSKGEKQLQREGKRHSMRESRSFRGLKSPSGWCLQDSHPRKIRAYGVLGVSIRQVEWTAVIGAAAWTLMSREQSANKSYIKMVSHASVLCVWPLSSSGSFLLIYSAFVIVFWTLSGDLLRWSSDFSFVSLFKWWNTLIFFSDKLNFAFIGWTLLSFDVFIFMYIAELSLLV